MPSLPVNIPSLATRCAPGVQLIQCTQPDNPPTLCLKAEAAEWGKIAHNPAFAQLKVPARYRNFPADPFDVQPPDAVPLNATPTAPTLLSSMIAGRFTPIVSFQVPPGYDGVINSIMLKFAPQTGPALQDGSGMLTWIIQINNYLAIGYSSVIIQIGDIPSLGPKAHDGGIRIKANDLVQIYAVLSAAGAAYLDPNGIVLGALQGWIYPLR